MARSPKRIGSKVRGVGVSLSCYVGGTIGFDGLLVIMPDGRVRFQSGIGNLGTESVIDVHRAGAEILGVPWEKCDVVWGDTIENFPFTCASGGSQTTHAMTRAAYAVAMDAKRNSSKLPRRPSAASPKITRSRTNASSAKGRRGHDFCSGGPARDQTGRHLRWP